MIEKTLNLTMNCLDALKKWILLVLSESTHPGSAFKELTEHLFLRINKTRKGISVFTEINHKSNNVSAHGILTEAAV